MTDAPDPMAEIKASFFIECDELLEALQDGLQMIENGDDDAETINIVFRAVHSIKGGAGAFGLEGLVRFAHRFETVLDGVRSGKMSVTPDLLALFFSCGDHLADLVRISRDEEDLPTAVTDGLLKRLNEFCDDDEGEEAEEEPAIDFAPMGISLDLDLDADIPEPEAVADLPDLLDLPELPDLPDLPDLDSLPDPAETGKVERDFVITFTPQAELFDTGNEPATLLRNLQDLGTATVECRCHELPKLSMLTPEVPHLTWVVELSTKAEQSEIASIFEFVEGLCKLDIVRGSPAKKTAKIEPTALPEAAEATPVEATAEAKPPEPKAEPAPATEGAKPPVASAEKKPAAAKSGTGGAPAANAVVRVDLERIERLVNLVGELVINQAMLSQSLENSGLSPHSNAMNGLEEFQRLTRDIQDSVMMIRAQPVKSLFQRMSRIVREASGAVGKDVRLHTEGEGTEVDKTVIERLADPLTHMIRNAVDHGLEKSETRIANGKPAQGRVNLTAAHRSGRVVIEVSDDGAGINRPKVLEIAISKGLVPADAQLSETEIDNLLFMPGFSTAEVVSDLSGRGVGMDVVRTSIQALGGRITITSDPGKGTVFSISLPLTLAVLDGMVVHVADETLVLPLNLVVETLTLTDAEVESVRPGVQVVLVRGSYVPLFDLGAALGYREPITSHNGAVALIIAHEDGGKFALVIDNIQDQRQVVIKGLDDHCYRAPGIAAATILGDGQIALILDPSDIIANAQSSQPIEKGIPA